jgi:hypothetical protein
MTDKNKEKRRKNFDIANRKKEKDYQDKRTKEGERFQESIIKKESKLDNFDKELKPTAKKGGLSSSQKQIEKHMSKDEAVSKLTTDSKETKGSIRENRKLDIGNRKKISNYLDKRVHEKDKFQDSIIKKESKLRLKTGEETKKENIKTYKSKEGEKGDYKLLEVFESSNEEIKSFLSRQKDTFRNSYGKFEEDRPRQCLFAGTTNTKQFLPFDRTGARRFLVIEVDSSKAEKHLLDNEEESRAYFDQLWAEAMVIFNSCKDKGSLLKHPKEMEKQIIEYRKQFMQEDTMAGQVQGWLDGYAGTYVCSRQIWKEAFNHYDGEPRKYETNEICQIMDTQIIGWKRGGYHRFSKEGFGTQRCWIREGKEETETVNQQDKDGFIKLTEGEQMKIPFD